MEVLRAAGGNEWETLASESFVPLTVTHVAPRFTASLHRCSLDATVTVSRVEAAACTVERTASLVETSRGGDLIFTIQTSGPLYVEQQDRRVLVADAAGVPYLTGRPYTLLFPEANNGIEVQVGLDRLGLGVPRLSDLVATAMPSSDPALTVLRRYLTALFESGALKEPGDLPDYAQVTTDLLGTVLRRGGSAAPPPLRSVLDRALRLVGAELYDPDLTTRTLAARLEISVRSLHTAFGQAGLTPAAFIRRARLHRACRLLRTTDATISDIAIEVGFSDALTFTRAFRRHNGCTPSHWRAAR